MGASPFKTLSCQSVCISGLFRVYGFVLVNSKNSVLRASKHLRTPPTAAAAGGRCLPRV